MAQQTAVDWIINKIYMVIPNEERDFLEGLREQAKAIEKEQIIDAAKVILFSSTGPGDAAAERYYNEKYNHE